MGLGGAVDAHDACPLVCLLRLSGQLILMMPDRLDLAVLLMLTMPVEAQRELLMLMKLSHWLVEAQGEHLMLMMPVPGAE